MTGKIGFVWSQKFCNYNFSSSHPLRPARFLLPYELIKAYGLLNIPEVTVYTPEPATEKDIETVHQPDYIDCVRKLDLQPELEPLGWKYGLGPGDNPVFKGMYDAATVHVGSTILCCELVAQNRVEHAFSPGGGFHHAMPDRASGFCLFNDIAIGIRRLQSKYGIKKILYLDIDAHHGDGVQWIFYKDPGVLTLSFHETGRFLFPGTGFSDEIGRDEGTGFALNIPLPPNTDNHNYMFAFNELFPRIVNAYKPELIFMQSGVDTHYSDPLAHLSLTTAAYSTIMKTVHRIAHEHCAGRLIVVGGGGYNITLVARAWTLMFSELAGKELDDNIPEKWCALCERVGEEPPKQLHDTIRKDEKLFSDVKKAVDAARAVIEKYINRI